VPLALWSVSSGNIISTGSWRQYSKCHSTSYLIASALLCATGIPTLSNVAREYIPRYIPNAVGELDNGTDVFLRQPVCKKLWSLIITES